MLTSATQAIIFNDAINRLKADGLYVTSAQDRARYFRNLKTHPYFGTTVWPVSASPMRTSGTHSSLDVIIDDVIWAITDFYISGVELSALGITLANPLSAINKQIGLKYNTTNLRIDANGQLNTVFDLSAISGVFGGSTGVTDHGALTGLLDDDHTQYIINYPLSDGRNVITSNSDVKLLSIIKDSTQTKNILEISDDTLNPLFTVSANGDLNVSKNINLAYGYYPDYSALRWGSADLEIYGYSGEVGILTLKANDGGGFGNINLDAGQYVDITTQDLNVQANLWLTGNADITGTVKLSYFSGISDRYLGVDSTGNLIIVSATSASINGTVGRIPKFATTTSLIDSLIAESGGTLSISGDTTIGSGQSSSMLSINGAINTIKQIIFKTSGSNRWVFRCASDIESGSDAGSSFQLIARNDIGNTIDTPISILRPSGGVMALNRPVIATSILNVSGATSLGTTLLVGNSRLTVNLSGRTIINSSTDHGETFQVDGNAWINGGVTHTSYLNVSGAVSLASSLTFAAGQDLIIQDNYASSFTITQSGNPYLRFSTLDGAEQITVYRATTFNSTVNISATTSIDSSIIVKNTVKGQIFTNNLTYTSGMYNAEATTSPYFIGRDGATVKYSLNPNGFAVVPKSYFSDDVYITGTSKNLVFTHDSEHIISAAANLRIESRDSMSLETGSGTITLNPGLAQVLIASSSSVEIMSNLLMTGYSARVSSLSGSSNRLVQVSSNGTMSASLSADFVVMAMNSSSNPVGGTTNYYSKFSQTRGIVNSLIYDDGSSVFLSRNGTSDNVTFYVNNTGTTQALAILGIRTGGVAPHINSQAVVEYGLTYNSIFWYAGTDTSTSAFTIAGNTTGSFADGRFLTIGLTGRTTLNGSLVTMGALSATGTINFNSLSGVSNRQLGVDSAGNLIIVGATSASINGTVGKIPKFATTTSLTDSLLSESGTLITLSGSSVITASLNVSGVSTLAKIIIGTGTYASGQSQLFSTTNEGLLIYGKTGTTYDLAISNAANTANVLAVPTGTNNALFNGNVSMLGRVAIGTGIQNSVSLTIAPSNLVGTSQFGMDVEPTFNTSATVAGYAGYFKVTNSGTFAMANAYSVFIQNATFGTSTVTNSYGLYIASQTGATNNYAIKTGTGKVELGDVVKIGTGTPSYTAKQLTIIGNSFDSTAIQFEDTDVALNANGRNFNIGITHTSSIDGRLDLTQPGTRTVLSVFKSGNVSIGSTTDSVDKFQVSGSVRISDNLNFTGDLSTIDFAPSNPGNMVIGTDYSGEVDDMYMLNNYGAIGFAAAWGIAFSTSANEISMFAPLVYIASDTEITGLLQVGTTLNVDGQSSLAGVTINGGSSGQGKIYTTSTIGLALQSKAGSSYDFSILAIGGAGSYVMRVPQGTTTAEFPNNVIIEGQLKVVSRSAFGGGVVGSDRVMYIGAGVASTQGGGVSQYGIVLNPLAGTDASTSFYVQYNEAKSNGSTTHLAGLYIESGSTTGGTVANNYGLKIQNQSVGTSNWAIKTELGKVEFGDQLVVSGTSVTKGRSAFGGASLSTSMVFKIGDSAAASLTQGGGSVQIGQYIDFRGGTDATSSSRGLQVNATSQNSSFIYSIIAGSNVKTGGSLSSSYGIYVENQGSLSTPTNAYGLYVEDQTDGGTNWAIKTGLGKVEFGDQLVVSGTSVTKGKVGLAALGVSSVTAVIIGNGYCSTQGNGSTQYGLAVNPLAGTDASNYVTSFIQTITQNNLVGNAYGMWIPSPYLSGSVDAYIGLLLDASNLGPNSTGGGKYALYVTSGVSVFADETNSSQPSSLNASVQFYGGVSIEKRLFLDGTSQKTLAFQNSVANGLVATTLGSVGPTGSNAGNPLGWIRVQVGANDQYIPYW